MTVTVESSSPVCGCVQDFTGFADCPLLLEGWPALQSAIEKTSGPRLSSRSFLHPYLVHLELIRGFYWLIQNIVPLSVDHTLFFLSFLFLQLPIELRLSSRLRHIIWSLF